MIFNRRILQFSIACLLALCSVVSNASEQQASAQQTVAGQGGSTLPVYSTVYDAKRDPFADAKAAITLANQTDRNILIEIGGSWCSWCKKIDAFLTANPDVQHALNANFVRLKVSVSDENENSAFMAGLPPVLGYPHMYVSTAQGKVMLSKDTAEFLINGEYSKERWLAFIDSFGFANNQANLQKQAQLSQQNNSDE
ncbi:thioredoxin family protein [Thalassotalea maritima]|uniref:thioredoxin family protein n=1 Tax=Thalassotalea maritima TaxID=3242416 RepID=UPI0035297E2B